VLAFDPDVNVFGPTEYWRGTTVLWSASHQLHSIPGSAYRKSAFLRSSARLTELTNHRFSARPGGDTTAGRVQIPEPTAFLAGTPHRGSTFAIVARGINVILCLLDTLNALKKATVAAPKRLRIWRLIALLARSVGPVMS
jgi:hypothetical protein